jgi:hypothetical protein
MEIPCCPDPAHAGSQVVRAGWYGKKPHRRQRWLCRPKNGDRPHRFAELLPRQQTRASCCLECSTQLETWEGQSGPRRYNFTAREIAHALKLVAGGKSYRGAAAETRQLAHRLRVPNPRSSKWRQFKRNPNLDGQIVANWVDTFAPALMQQLPECWPSVVLVDSINFRITSGPRMGRGFYVFAAVAYENAPGGSVARPRVCQLRAYGRKNPAAWEDFYRSLPGTPEILISDMDTSLRLAAKNIFPRLGDPPPDLRMCEWHVKRSLELALGPLKGQPKHPLWPLFEHALRSPADWAAFEQAAQSAHAAALPPLRSLDRWLKRYGPPVKAQMATRRPADPRSIAAVEATLKTVAQAFDNKRSSVFGNQARMNLLLGLMALDIRDQSNELDWAERIRQDLAGRSGVAVGQRPFDDPYRQSSLVA